MGRHTACDAFYVEGTAFYVEGGTSLLELPVCRFVEVNYLRTSLQESAQVFSEFGDVSRDLPDRPRYIRVHSLGRPALIAAQFPDCTTGFC